MPSAPVDLGNLHFAKKGDAVSYLHDMLYRYDLGDRLSQADADVLKLALDRHPDSVEKIGTGVQSFSVRSGDFGTRCFWINRSDGTTVKFSHRACIYGT